MRWFRDEDEPMLRTLHRQGLDDHEIARAMGFSRLTIFKRRHRMGLPANGPHTPRSRAKRSRKMSKHCAGEGMFLIGLKYRCMAAQLGWPGHMLTDAFTLNALERLGTAKSTAIREQCNLTRRRYGKSAARLVTVQKSLARLRREGHVESGGYLGRGWKRWRLTASAESMRRGRAV